MPALPRVTLSLSKGRHALGVLAAIVLALPGVASAQDTVQLAVPFHQRTLPHDVRPSGSPRPVRPQPRPSNRPGNQRNRRGNAYPVIIDGSVIDRYAPAAAPVPVATKKPIHKPTPRPKDAPDQFESHSSTDAHG